MDEIKALMEKKGEARKRITNLTKERASKINELEALMSATEQDEDKIAAIEADLDAIKNKINRENSLINNYDEQITDLQNQKQAGFQNNGFHAGIDSPDSETKELQNYSFLDTFRALKQNSTFDRGMAMEMHQEGVKEAKEHGVELSGNGLVIPMKALKGKKFDRSLFTGNRSQRIVNDVTAGTAGTKTIETESIDFVSLLRERLILRQLGARFVTDLNGNIPLTNQTAGFTFGWAATENATASESTSTYSQATLSPKRGTGFQDVSNQWLLQTSPEIEAAFVEDMINGTRVGIETAAINGSGSSGEPEGILNKSGIGVAYAGGAAASGTNANGAAQAFADWVNVMKEVEVDNADLGSLAYLTNSKVKAQAMLTKIDSGSGIFIWDKLMAMDELIGVSNIVPSDLSKGSSDDLSALIYGNFNDLWIGQWGGLEVFQNPYTKAKDAITEMIIHVYIDVAIRRAESFAAVQDIDAQ